MRNIKILIFFLIIILLIDNVRATTIYGTVYDLSLKKVSNALVEINSSPRQFMVAQNGSYFFEVGNGDYVIKSQFVQKNNLVGLAQENITIRQSGSYVMDLILFPDIGEGVEDIDFDIDSNIVDENSKSNRLFLALLLAAAAIAASAYFYFVKKKMKREEKKADGQKKEDREYNDLEQVIRIIRQEGGRATQKDIRKQIPFSEAKISLMIAELEHKGVIEKIKKGRGNIIILKNEIQKNQ